MMGEFEFVTEMIEEYGEQYVEALVAEGYTPRLINSIWRWVKSDVSMSDSVNATASALNHSENRESSRMVSL